MKHERYKSFLKATAHELGFFHIGFSKAAFLEEEAPRLTQWLDQKAHGSMSYMANHFDKRLDPRLLEPGTKTIISLLLNYYPEQGQQDSDAPKLSKYAYGQDYHYVIKDKLRQFMAHVHKEIGEVQGRGFVDSAPVMDKVWAKKAGLGWMGKNTNLIHPKHGSFFFIAELLTDLELEPDGPLKDYCGTCTRCIDACPTDALVAPYQIDASKCISYLTIELKDALLPKEFAGKLDNWMFGCDVCQDVCPWNRFSKAHQEAAFQPTPDLLNLSKNEWEELSEETYRQLFQNSAVKRSKYSGLKRNIQFLKH
ncbi:MAG: tRNA epoxyqueuosine(34) reductase QueG [Bacteroidota bacterium]|jgi:epoxyqueuosine reductase